MRELEDKEIFHLFQSRLTDTDNFTNDFNSNWLELENLLEEKKNRKSTLIKFYRTLSGIAAMLILFFCWQMANNSFTTKKNAIAGTKQNKALSSEGHKVPKERDSANNISNDRKLFAGQVKKRNTAIAKVYLNSPDKPLVSEHPAQQNSLVAIPDFKDKLQIALAGGHLSANDSLFVLQLVANSSMDTAKYKIAVPFQKQKTKAGKDQGPRFALAVLVAPEMSGISSFNSVKAGSNLSVQLSYRITKKLSISTGVDYSDKPYSTSFANYRGGKTAWWNKTFANKGLPEDVLADCKVLDIPINLNYQVFSRGKNSIILGSGISSYFMLRENYSFRFSDPLSQSENLDLKNDNKHMWSVLNLNSTFKHKLNNNFGVIIQPYMKLPLNKIGFGQVNLKSAGVAVGFSWNIRNVLKKK